MVDSGRERIPAEKQNAKVGSGTQPDIVSHHYGLASVASVPSLDTVS